MPGSPKWSLFLRFPYLISVHTSPLPYMCCCIVTPTCTVLLFCHKHFIDVYCHMFIAALEFTLRRSREIVLRNESLYVYCSSGVYVTQVKGNGAKK